MRHQIEVWEHQGGRADPQELQRMKELIGIYDSAVKTGNETLDTILTERSLYCEKHGIRLSCIVDGSKLRFLSDGDICALFGNALENAIEAVSKLERPEDRNISFQVRENRGMLVITVDNYYAGTLRFDGPLPQTTKENGGYHGYGLKSIRMVAEKYGGEVTITADDGMFHLSVLLPIPAE
jgi:sensor histidine kinase regulating citrate/malate metabolism